MRVMVIVKASKEYETENNPFESKGSAELFEATHKLNVELNQAGIMLAGDGLKASKSRKRIHPIPEPLRPRFRGQAASLDKT